MWDFYYFLFTIHGQKGRTFRSVPAALDWGKLNKCLPPTDDGVGPSGPSPLAALGTGTLFEGINHCRCSMLSVLSNA